MLIDTNERRGVEYVSWTEALQKVTERERSLFDIGEQLWPVNEHTRRALGKSNSEAIEDEESAEEEVDLNAEPAKTSFKKSKPLKTYGGDRAQTLVPGTYTYHLRWKAPLGLPLSFEDSTSATWMGSEGAVVPKMLSKGHSYIRYHALVSLVVCKSIQVQTKPSDTLPASSYWKEVSKTIDARGYFKMLEDVPVGALTAQPPLQSTQEKTFLFGGDAPLRLSVVVENGGLAFVGKSFNAVISVDNKSSRAVELVRIGIDCFTTFRVAAPKTAPVQAGLAGSQVQHLHPDATVQVAEGQWIDNVTRRENILNTGLNELSNIAGGSLKASRISITVPSYWPGSIVTSVHIERRYEFFAECVVSMGTNLITRCPIRLLEWCDFFNQVLPDIAPSQQERDLEEFDIDDDDIDGDNDGLKGESDSKKEAKPVSNEASSSAAPSSSSSPDKESDPAENFSTMDDN